MRRPTALSALVLALAAIGGGASASTNYVVNGNFTDGASPWVSTQTDGGASDSVEIYPSYVYGLPCITAGCLNAEVNANAVDTLSQTITGLTPGQTYSLVWDYGGRNGGGPQTLDVTFGGVAVTTDSSDGSDAFWTFNRYTVTATSATETLSFISQPVEGSDPTYGNELTNVSLSSPTPEPAAWAMMLVGFGGVGAALRMRARKAAAAA